jgi:hypothetical protein
VTNFVHSLSPRLNRWQAFIVFLLLYATGLLWLLPRLSLWLDEILDLKAVRDLDFGGLMAYIAANGGGVPLGYLAQVCTVRSLGYSTFSGRLPSALFSLVACAGIFVMGRQLKLARPILATVIFCLCPLQLRYALEARPYSQALALSVWATVAFISLVEEPRFARAFVCESGRLCRARPSGSLYPALCLVCAGSSHQLDLHSGQ